CGGNQIGPVGGPSRARRTGTDRRTWGLSPRSFKRFLYARSRQRRKFRKIAARICSQFLGCGTRRLFPNRPILKFISNAAGVEKKSLGEINDDAGRATSSIDSTRVEV